MKLRAITKILNKEILPENNVVTIWAPLCIAVISFTVGYTHSQQSDDDFLSDGRLSTQANDYKNARSIKAQVANRQMLNPILYMAENGCKWHRLPNRFGLWNTICQPMSRWAKNGVLDQVFETGKEETGSSPEALSLDSTSRKVPPDGTGASPNGLFPP